MSGDNFAYVGGELHLFARARHWKAYLAEQVQPFLGRSVLEVGAGLGATTQALCRQPHERWVCLGPDAQLASAIEDRRAAGTLPACCDVVVGTRSHRSRPVRYHPLRRRVGAHRGRPGGAGARGTPPRAGGSSSCSRLRTRRCFRSSTGPLVTIGGTGAYVKAAGLPACAWCGCGS